MSEKKVAYISGALTNVKELSDMQKFYEAIGEVCAKNGYSPYIPHKHIDPVLAADVSPGEVWRTDYNAVSQSAVVVAFVGEPSLGVGAELEIARENKVPIILMARESDRVSRMARGNPAVTREIRFKAESDGLKELIVALRSLSNE